MTQPKKLTNRELREWMNMCSSIDPRTGAFKPSAILNSNGQPVTLEEFLRQTGQRTLQTRADFSKSPKEKEEYRIAKSNWKQGMITFFGKDWKKNSSKVGCNNVPTDKEVRQEIKKELKLL